MSFVDLATLTLHRRAEMEGRINTLDEKCDRAISDINKMKMQAHAFVSLLNCEPAELKERFLFVMKKLDEYTYLITDFNLALEQIDNAGSAERTPVQDNSALSLLPTVSFVPTVYIHANNQANNLMDALSEPASSTSGACSNVCPPEKPKRVTLPKEQQMLITFSSPSTSSESVPNRRSQMVTKEIQCSLSASVASLLIEEAPPPPRDPMNLPAQSLLEVDREYHGVISATAGVCFWIITEDSQELSDFMHDITDYYGQHSTPLTDEQARALTYCAVYDDETGLYYRAMYIKEDETEPDNVSLFFMDTGEIRSAPASCLRPLASPFRYRPPYARYCHLAGITLIDYTNKALVQKYEDVMAEYLNVPATFYVDENESESTGVYVNLPTKQLLNDILVQRGLAVAIDRPEESETAGDPPEETRGPQEVARGLPGMAHVSPGMAHVSPGMAHVPPGMAHVPPGMAHGPPEMAHGPPGMVHGSQQMAHGPPGMVHGPPGMVHGPQEMAYGPPGMAHGPLGIGCGAPEMDRGPPGMARDPPGMARSPPGLARGPPGLARGPPGLAHGPPEIARVQPLMARSPPVIARGPPGMANGLSGMAHGPPGMTHGPPGMTHGPPEMTHGPPEMAGGEHDLSGPEYDDPVEAVTGYHNRDEEDICKHYKGGPAKTCFKGPRCTKRHVMKHPDGWTLDRVEVIAKIKPTPLPQPDSWLKVLVTAVPHFDRVYINLVNENQQPEEVPEFGVVVPPSSLPALVRDMNSPAARASYKPLQFTPAPGEMVAALYPPDGRWYRACVRISSRVDQSVEVQYIDYGTEMWVKEDQIRVLDPRYTFLPSQAIRCVLAGVFLPGEDSQRWVRARKALADIVQDRTLHCHVIARDYDEITVELVDSEDYSVAQHLAAQGLVELREYSVVDDSQLAQQLVVP